MIKTPKNSKYVKFASIRSITNEINYFNYIHAITSFDYIVTDDEHDFADKNYKITKQDVKIVNKLLKNRKESKKNNIPLYITNLFDSFRKNKVEIEVKLIKLDQEFVVFKNKMDMDITKITNICHVFENCKKIWFNFNQGKWIGNVKEGIISSEFFEDLLSEISELNKSKNKLFSIYLNKAQWNVNTFESYKTKFAEQNWKMTQEDKNQIWLLKSN